MLQLLKTHTLRAVMLLFIASMALVSCKKAPEQSKLIPGDANMVFMVDMGEIKSKNTDFTKILDYVSGDLTEDQKKLMESGVDLDGFGYFFGKASDEEGGYGAGIIPLADKEKFESLLKEENKSFEKVEDEDNIYKLDRNTYVHVSESQAVFTSTEGFDKSLDVVAKLKEILNTEEANSLPSTDDNFKKAVSSTKDMFFWAKPGEIYSDLPKGMKEEELNLSDTYLKMDVTFDDGQAVMDIVLFGNDEIAEINKVSSTGGANSAVTNQLNGEAPIAALSISDNLEATHNYFKEKGYEDLYSSMLSGMGFEVDELAKFLTGDIAVVVNDMKQEGYGMPQADFTASAGLKDREKFESFLSSQGLMIEDDQIDLMGINGFVEDEAVRVVGMQESYVSKVKNKETEKLNGDITSMMLDNELSLFIDITKIPETYTALVGGKEGPVGEFQTLKLTAKADGRDVKMNLTIDFTDKEENSLMILSRLGKKADQMM